MNKEKNQVRRNLLIALSLGFFILALIPGEGYPDQTREAPAQEAVEPTPNEAAQEATVVEAEQAEVNFKVEDVQDANGLVELLKGPNLLVSQLSDPTKKLLAGVPSGKADPKLMDAIVADLNRALEKPALASELDKNAHKSGKFLVDFVRNERKKDWDHIRPLENQPMDRLTEEEKRQIQQVNRLIIKDLTADKIK